MSASTREKAEALVEQGLQLYSQGRLDDALIRWRHALQLDAAVARASEYLRYVEENRAVLESSFQASQSSEDADMAPDRGGAAGSAGGAPRASDQHVVPAVAPAADPQDEDDFSLRIEIDELDLPKGPRAPSGTEAATGGPFRGGAADAGASRTGPFDVPAAFDARPPDPENETARILTDDFTAVPDRQAPMDDRLEFEPATLAPYDTPELDPEPMSLADSELAQLELEAPSPTPARLGRRTSPQRAPRQRAPGTAETLLGVSLDGDQIDSPGELASAPTDDALDEFEATGDAPPPSEPGSWNVSDAAEALVVDADMDADGGEERVQAMLAGAWQLHEQGTYEGSLWLCERILSVDPGHDQAAKLLEGNQAALVRQYEETLVDLDRVPVVQVSQQDIIWHKLDHRAGFLLSRIDGVLCYAELLDISGMGRFETCRILAQLLDQGVIASR